MALARSLLPLASAAVVLPLVLVLVVGLSAAAPLVKEQLRGVPSSWAHVSRADGQTPVTLHVFVKQQNLHRLNRILFAVSDPTSAEYGKHLTFDEVNYLVAPRVDAVEAVFGWLQSHGIDLASQVESTPNDDIVQVTTTVAVAERLLNAEYNVYRHSTGKTVLRTLNYSLPEEVSPHVDFVGPTVRFPALSTLTRSGRPQQDGVDPDFLRSLYSVDSYFATNPKNLQGIASFLEQYMDQSDLTSFFAQVYPAAPLQTATIIGPNDPTNPGDEAMLDIEYIMSLGANVTSQFWSTPGTQPHNPENEPFLVWLYNVSNTTNAPYVFSISYGDDEDTVWLDYAERVNVEFQKAGVRGISLIAASGDGGVGGSQPSECTVFVPTFPADSPYITAVGGTTSSGPEVASSLSGGGFSNYWARPTFQDAAVKNYFAVAQNLPDPSLYNHTGAGFPDVSAQAEGFIIVLDGFEQGVDGTSCASPTFAGIVSLLNDVRFNQGKSSLGWLNPLFYQNPQGFTDITSGNNPGCDTNGFQASTGWDPVTGLGTANFAALRKIVSALP